MAAPSVGSTAKPACEMNPPSSLPCTRPHPYPCRVLDRTKTKCGARLLRANLLQPLRDIPTLNAR